MLHLLIQLYNETSFASTRHAVINTVRALTLIDEKCCSIAKAEIPELASSSAESRSPSKGEEERRKRLARERKAN